MDYLEFVIILNTPQIQKTRTYDLPQIKSKIVNGFTDSADMFPCTTDKVTNLILHSTINLQQGEYDSRRKKKECETENQ